MYLSYPLAVLAALPVFLLVRIYSGSDLWAVGITALQLLWLAPKLRRLSRGAWIHLDYWLGRR